MKISFVLFTVTINLPLIMNCYLMAISLNKHPNITTSQAILKEEDQMLTTSKPHKVYDEIVSSANPLTSSSSQSEEPKNLKQVQNRQYILQKKLKDLSK